MTALIRHDTIETSLETVIKQRQKIKKNSMQVRTI